MGRQRWALALLLVVGVALGVGVAGLPHRSHDAPLRVTDSTTSTTGNCDDGLRSTRRTARANASEPT